MSGLREPSGQLLHNLALFGRVLRGLGLHCDPARLVDLVQAAELVGLRRRRDFQAAARCLLVRRREEIPLFDHAFDSFWRKPAQGFTTLDLRALGERRRFRRPRFAPASALPETGPGSEAAAADQREPPLLQPVLTWSAREQLRHKDFGEMSGEELERVQALIAQLEWTPGERRSRRSQPGRGRLPDLRRSLRHSLRHGGELLHWVRRRPRTRPRPLVVLADISGSMERYTRLLLLFVYALSRRLGERRLEAFLFGTRLTRVTRPLQGRDLEAALREVARAVPDWSGGTRIGEAIRAFNFLWARRVLGRGAVVLVISDGWDRGDVSLLAAEMARLQRSCQRLIWLNPLLGAPEYQPLARGIRAALPHVDDFLPVHDLVSLEQLAAHLARVAGRRPARAQRPSPRLESGDA